MFGWGKGPEHIPRTTLHSEQIPSAENGWSGQNYTGFENAEMDALIEAINLEIDRTKRKAMWDRLQEIYAEDRKSVVSGKSGSVRVDIGGRRLIKKKKKDN